MSEENIEKMIEMIKGKAYTPGGMTGIADCFKVVDLDDVLRIIEELRDKK